MGCTQSKGSEHGKHFAPSNKTIAIYHGFRGDAGRYAQLYVDNGHSEDIAARRAGDFHDHRMPKKVAYFTYDKAYARKLAGPTGKIVRIDLPRAFYHQHRMYKFDDVPAAEWYQLVEANRRQVSLPRGRMRNIRNYDLIEGPISHSSNHVFTKSTGPVAHARFKPAQYNDDPNGEYIQQLAVGGEALNRVNRLGRRFTP